MDKQINLITVKDYAELHGVSPRTVRQKAQAGTLKAHKIGENWLIDKDEPYIDNRIKSGKYIGWRKKKKE